MKWSALAERLHQSLKEKALLKEKDKILVAVSGGLDSVVLLHLLLELKEYWKWQLVLGHIDHGFRPDEDDKETELCLALAEKYGLESRIEALSGVMYDKGSQIFTSQNPSQESLARHKRYEIYKQWAYELKCDAVCTGHHQSDQAETVLYRMLTGSGFKGLNGIPSSRNIFKRPLLDIPKEDIRAYAREKEIIYFEDSSNQNTKFIRNKIRLDIIPYLKKKGFTNVESMLASSTSSIEEASTALEHYCQIAYDELMSEDRKRFELNISGFLALPVYIKKMVLRKACEERLNLIEHISEKQLDQLIAFIANAITGSQLVFMGKRFIKDRDILQLITEEKTSYNQVFICSPSSLIPDHSLKIDLIRRQFEIWIWSLQIKTWPIFQLKF